MNVTPAAMSSKAHASHSPTARETAPHTAFKGLLIANNSIPLRMCSHEKCQCCLAKFPSLGCGIMQACSTNCSLDVFLQPSPTSHHPTPPHTIMITPPLPTPTSPTSQAENAALEAFGARVIHLQSVVSSGHETPSSPQTSPYAVRPHPASPLLFCCPPPP